jgi:hypothetical protein
MITESCPEILLVTTQKLYENCGISSSFYTFVGLLSLISVLGYFIALSNNTTKREEAILEETQKESVIVLKELPQGNSVTLHLDWG